MSRTHHALVYASRPTRSRGHGVQATASTALHERLGFSPDVIEAQLAHSVRDSLGGRANRSWISDVNATGLGRLPGPAEAR
jgi:hypothetical protein